MVDARRLGGRSKSRSRPLSELKAEVVRRIGGGETVANACMAVDRTVATYRKWCLNDEVFKAQIERIRGLRTEAWSSDRDEFPAFEDFSLKYLGDKVFPHMMNVVDLMEGREPSWTHPAMTLDKGERDLIICNMPPEHGKSSTITMNYATYRIVQDPNIRILIVSKTEAMAKKFLFGIKERLTHPMYAEMHAQFGPPGGFDQNSEAWSQKLIYVSPDARDAGSKDPTVEALGIRGHIYGARADLIILDDCVDDTNAHEYDKQIDWIQAVVMSRISVYGSLLVVGTRMAPKDLYQELRDGRRYPDEVSPWTYLSMPAVLEFAEKPSDWVTLWPQSNRPEPGARGDELEPNADGLFPKWNGPRLLKKRSRMQPKTWAMVYMQQQVSEDAVFRPEAINESINGNRVAGMMPRGMVGCRKNGMDGLVIVAGMDPAMSGYTAAVVIGLDPVTQKRHVLDISNKAAMTPDGIRELIKSWTDKYSISEWRIEKNAFQSMLTQDREILTYLTGRGCILREHTTGRNKWAPDFGVASLSMLWSGWQDKRNLIELPSTVGSEAAKTLVEQLVTWHPDAPKTQKTDIVMALWFTELACRDRLSAITNKSQTHSKNPYATRADMRSRNVIRLYDADNEQLWRSV